MFVHHTKNFRYYIPENIEIKKFAMFDLDGTLITSASGRNPAYKISSEHDWVYLGDVLPILKNISDECMIIIVTNQSHLGQKGGEIIQNKLELIIQNMEEYNIHPIFLVSTSKDNTDIYRKPNTGSITFLLELLKLQQIPEGSFMVGDAAYEPELVNQFPPYDWGDADIKFANNLNVTFYRPNLIFKSNIDNDLLNIISSYNIIIMMGNPGSGKSTFSKLINNHIVLESDILHKKLYSNYIKLLKTQSNIVIDATNPTQEIRYQYISEAFRLNLSVIIVWSIRDGRSWNNLRENKVPNIVYNIYSKKFENPELDISKVKVIKIY